MANTPVMGFAFQFEGDGSHNSISMILAVGPVSFFPFGSSAASPSLLSGVTSGVPSGVSQVNCAGMTVNSATLLLGILTVTFSANPTSGNIYTVSGLLEF